MSLLRERLEHTETLAREGELPAVELSNAGLKIGPLENSVPKDAFTTRLPILSVAPLPFR